ncbi:unnamed protein product, partial [Hymenolepis diminuta]
CADTIVIHLLLHCPFIPFVPYPFLTRLNPHYDLINTFWPSQLFVFLSVTVVAVFRC